MSSSIKLPLILFLASLLFPTTLGEIICEELTKEVCAFSISSSGKRCLLENLEAKNGMEYQCTTSDMIVARMAEHIETDACVNACGVDRTTVGISSDSLLEQNFTAKLCSAYCYHNCPNIIDLYFNLAAGEGVFLPDLCEKQKINPHRAMQVLMNYVRVRAVASNYEAEDDAPSPSSENDGTEADAPAPAPSNTSDEMEEDAPSPSSESADNEEEAPAPSSESSETEEDAPAPSSESHENEEVPAPSSESADNEDDAPSPSREGAENEEDAPAQSSESTENEDDAQAPSSESDENEEAAPAPSSESAKKEKYIPSLLSGSADYKEDTPAPSSEIAENEEEAPAPAPSSEKDEGAPSPTSVY